MRTPVHLVCLGVVLCAGCGDEDSGSTAPPPPSVSNDPELVLPAQLPTGWKIGPTSSQRSASYVIEGKGTVADVSLQVLPGQAGGLLQHLNRWRDQLGLQALDQLTFEEQSSWRTTPVGEGLVIDLTGLAKGADPAFDGRTVAVVVEQPSRTWFFKLRGNADLVDAQMSAFVDWVDTVGVSEPNGASVSAPPEPAPLESGKEPAAGSEPTWKVPEDWLQTPAGGGRHAIFSLTGPQQSTGRVEVALLADFGNDALPHVNRWRQQSGLPPIARKDLAPRVQSIFNNGITLSIMQFAGPGGSVIAAWTPGPEGTWIITLTGPASVIEAHRSKFATFLLSIHLRNP